MNKDLELRMYIFVPYQLTGIQKGIQAGHAVEQYAKLYGRTEVYKEYVENHKTWIVLNGGVTSNGLSLATPGHLGNIDYELNCLNHNRAIFEEPDLNDAMTAVCFLADERVFNYKDYPDLEDYARVKLLAEDKHIDYLKQFRDGPYDMTDISVRLPDIYKSWVKKLGGATNVGLRELLRNKRLA